MVAKEKSFSKTNLLNITIKEDILYADLHIEQSKSRVIDSVIVKDYENFPRKHIKHFYNLNKKPIFNQKKLITVSNQTKLLKFATELKPPEVLFSKDSTILYLYLKKTNANNFDGLINFSPKENKKGVSFNGYLDLRLINIFNFGEELSINWKNTGEDKQFFKINTKAPYLFDTKVISEVSFSIYKQDSTFLNSETAIQFSLPINYRTSAGIVYSFEKSEDLSTQASTHNIVGFNKNSIGVQLNYNSFHRNEFNFKAESSFNKRKTLTENISQYRINLHYSSKNRNNVCKALSLSN